MRFKWDEFGGSLQDRYWYTVARDKTCPSLKAWPGNGAEPFGDCFSSILVVTHASQTSNSDVWEIGIFFSQFHLWLWAPTPFSGKVNQSRHSLPPVGSISSPYPSILGDLQSSINCFWKETLCPSPCGSFKCALLLLEPWASHSISDPATF